MPKSDFRDPYNPRTREYLHGVLCYLPQEGPPLITIVKRATEGMEDRGVVLGVFPASFNPPTSAHQVMVREAAKTIPFDEVLLILDQQAMDKELFGAPLEDRLLMLLILFRDDSKISLGISNRGLFLEKVEAIQKVYPKDTQIHFIVGHDTIVRVLHPKYYEDRNNALRSLFSQARFLVANRGGCDERDLRDLLELEENRPFAAQALPLTIPPHLALISSSEVREKLAKEQSVQGLVPPELEEFLNERGFYRRHEK